MLGDQQHKVYFRYVSMYIISGAPLEKYYVRYLDVV